MLNSKSFLINIVFLSFLFTTFAVFQKNNYIPKLKTRIADNAFSQSLKKTSNKPKVFKSEPIPEAIRNIISPDRNSPEYTILMTKSYFPNEPIMHHVSRCESERIHRKNGKLLPNSTGGSAKGAFQVLMSKHKETMTKMGLNPNKDKDYFKYVKHLFEKRGTKDWYMSEHCWGKYMT